MILNKDITYLIEDMGTEVTLRKPTYGAYNPVTGTHGSASSTDYTVKCHFSDYFLSEVDNTNILLGDRRALIPTEDTSGNELPEPDTDDLIIGIGDTVKVVRVQQFYHFDTRICYILQVRE